MANLADLEGACGATERPRQVVKGKQVITLMCLAERDRRVHLDSHLCSYHITNIHIYTLLVSHIPKHTDPRKTTASQYSNLVRLAPAVLTAVLLLQGAAAAPQTNPRTPTVVNSAVLRPPAEDIHPAERRQNPKEGEGGNGGRHHKRQNPKEGEGGNGGKHP